MKVYSDVIFKKIEDLTLKKENLENIIKVKGLYLDLFFKVDRGDSNIKGLLSKTGISKTDSKLFIEMSKINMIAKRLNNYSFEQYLSLSNKYKSLKFKYLEELKSVNSEYRVVCNDLKVYEYVYELGLPINDDSLIDSISFNTDVLNLVLQENIAFYNKTEESEKQFSDKLDDLHVSSDIKDMILEVSQIVSTSVVSKATRECIDYILSMNFNDLSVYLNENLFKCDDSVIFGVLSGLVDNIDDSRSISAIKAIYDKYISIQKEEYEANIVDQPIIINLIKPTGNGYYIDEDLEKIESIPLVKRAKKQFEEIESGNLSGKPIKYMPVKGLFEKKDFKVRTTYKILANNYVVIINCYIKGTNEATKTRLRLNKNVEYQIKLYEALALGDKSMIDRLTCFIAGQASISSEEVQTYIDNFNSISNKLGGVKL